MTVSEPHRLLDHNSRLKTGLLEAAVEVLPVLMPCAEPAAVESGLAAAGLFGGAVGGLMRWLACFMSLGLSRKDSGQAALFRFVGSDRVVYRQVPVDSTQYVSLASLSLLLLMPVTCNTCNNIVSDGMGYVSTAPCQRKAFQSHVSSDIRGTLV